MNKNELKAAYKAFRESRNKNKDKSKKKKKPKKQQWYDKPGVFKYGFSSKCIADFYNEERRMAMHRNETIENEERRKRRDQLKRMGML